MKHYVPESLLLWVYPVESLKPFENTLPKPIPQIQQWPDNSEPLSTLGVDFININGQRLPSILKEFNDFPDYKIFKGTTPSPIMMEKGEH